MKPRKKNFNCTDSSASLRSDVCRKPTPRQLKDVDEEFLDKIPSRQKFGLGMDEYCARRKTHDYFKIRRWLMSKCGKSWNKVRPDFVELIGPENIKRIPWFVYTSAVIDDKLHFIDYSGDMRNAEKMYMRECFYIDDAGILRKFVKPKFKYKPWPNLLYFDGKYIWYRIKPHVNFKISVEDAMISPAFVRLVISRCATRQDGILWTKYDRGLPKHLHDKSIDLRYARQVSPEKSPKEIQSLGFIE
jgi:hypothetical protein